MSSTFQATASAGGLARRRPGPWTTDGRCGAPQTLV